MAYKGTQKQFIVKKLTPLTLYAFRLQAENSLGVSAWSTPALIYTSGCVPDPPTSPHLIDATTTSLTLGGWASPSASVLSSSSSSKTTTGNTIHDYELQMHAIEDPLASSHGFLTVYNGQLEAYEVRELKRAMAYLFRVRAKNEEGYSGWSEVAKFWTSADVPRSPVKLKIERTKLHQYRVQWEAPREDGGSPILFYSLELAPATPNHFYQCIYTGPHCEFTIFSASYSSSSTPSTSVNSSLSSPPQSPSIVATQATNG